MTQFNETVRIFGEELDEDDTFIDATIDGFSLDGKTRLVEDVDNNPRQWTVPATNIQDLNRKDMLVPVNELSEKNHDIWSIIEDLEAASDDGSLAAAEGELKRIVRKIFNESTRSQRSNGDPSDGDDPSDPSDSSDPPDN